jgi:integrase
MLKPAPSGGWKARKRIPADVQEEYSQRHGQRYEAKLTLKAGTKPGEARKRYGEWLVEVEGHIEAIRAERTGSSVSLTAMQAAALSGRWYAWFTERHNKSNGDEWDRWRDAVYDGIRNAVSERDARTNRPDQLWDERPEVREAVRPILADIVHTAQFLAGEKVALDHDARCLFLDCLYGDLAAAIKRFHRHADGDYSADTYVERFPKVEAIDSGITVSELFEKWVLWRKPASSTVETWRYPIRALETYLNGRSAGSMTAKEANSWIKDRVTPERTARSVSNTTLRACKRMFGWGVYEGLLTENPFALVKLTLEKRNKFRDKSFRTDEWRAILGASLEITDTTADGEAVRRWVPWLCAYTGARAGEITQLRKQDVLKRDGIDALELTPKAGTIKNREARTVPLHEHLLEQGFLDFVACKPEGPLFYSTHDQSPVPEPTKQRKSRAVQARQRLADWVRKDVGVVEKGVGPNHGWRHTFKAIGGEVDIPGKILDAICGHAPASTGDGYGAPTLKVMAKALEKFPRYQLVD